MLLVGIPLEKIARPVLSLRGKGFSMRLSIRRAVEAEVGDFGPW